MKNPILSRLGILMTATMLIAAPPAFAATGEAVLNIFQRAKLFLGLGFGRTSTAVDKAEAAGVPTDPKKIRGASPAADGLRKIFKADESILKECSAVEYSEKYLEGRPKYIGRKDKIIAGVARLLDLKMPHLLVTGEAGVGKTSYVEQLIRHLFANWEKIEGMREPLLYSISSDGIVKGTTFRGELEDKLDNLFLYLQAEAKKRNRTIILYIDEVHQIMGAGATKEGGGGLGDKLKPFMSGGDPESRVHVIGSTTREEAAILRQDKAVQRRFGPPVDLDSPTNEEAFAMLKGNIESYEAKYGVKYPDDVLQLFVDKSLDYVKDFVLPGPAFDMMGSAGARSILAKVESVEVTKLKTQWDAVQGRIAHIGEHPTLAQEADLQRLTKTANELKSKLEVAEKAWVKGREVIVANTKRLETIEHDLKMLQEEQLEAVMATGKEDLAGIKRNKDREAAIDIKIENLKAGYVERTKLLAEMRENMPTLTREEGYQAVAERTGYSVEQLSRSPEQLSNLLHKELPNAVTGQKTALKQIGEALEGGLSGLTMPGQPRGIITLVDSAAQKEEVVKAIDTLVFGAKNLDEVREAHLHTLIVDFASPTSRGFDIRELQIPSNQRPFRVYAFLNVERADPSVRNQLAELANTGRTELGSLRSGPNPLIVSDGVLIFHFGSIEDSRATLSSSDINKQITNFVKLFRLKNKEKDAVAFAELIASRSDAVVHLQAPITSDLYQVVKHKVELLNQALKKSLELEDKIEIQIYQKAAVKIAQEAKSVENIDIILKDVLLKELKRMIKSGEITGGEVIELAFIDGKFEIFVHKSAGVVEDIKH